MTKNPINLTEQLAGMMVKIPAGRITLRDDRTKQQWTQTINAFYLSKYLITQDLYFKITSENPSTFVGDKKPVETVSWLSCAIFCNTLSYLTGLIPYYIINPENSDFKVNPQSSGYRLPTDAEWEYACKAGQANPQYGNINAIAWYKQNANSQTQQVGLKEPNNWGLYDMLGNVWEWCSDIYDQTVYGSYRIIRGGGWNDEERGCLATNRRRSHPTAYKIDDLGFRIAQNSE